MTNTTPSPPPGPATKPSPSVHSTPTSTAGAKRKRGSAGKYYAVKAGYQPGVYYAWNDCLTQVTGYRGAVCKGPLYRVDMMCGCPTNGGFSSSILDSRRGKCIPYRLKTSVGAGRHYFRHRPYSILRHTAWTSTRGLYRLGKSSGAD
ncbi:hypothetical protein BDV40DRAFT_45275 [Aspergillus tamarii]|uniref:Ribonuclease H1 N-terminal domain-containing protein n=1 Tax=Aspergillus tamarii TaxID=41984 RepID=A0A5N6UH53_ASPTM|nr:hypothetical protein BDV40DRAFT_45275 [Aspergillus tamarii]